ncbi:MAG: hypothetical protein IT429_24695 [Gemmataceae bacterium]|nr:hypothetical protein [Gemmataceae bacterium]
MSESMPLAFLSDFREVVVFSLRVLLSLFGAWLGWLLARPVARILFRLAFQRPIPDKVLIVARLLGAVGAAALVFLLFPLALSGLGPGLGPGLGGGPGKGAGQVGGKGDGKDGDGKEKKEKKGEPYDSAKTLAIEMIPSAQYQGDGRYYLIGGKEPPRSLAQVKEYLEEHKKQVRTVEIVIYRNTPGQGHLAVKALQKLAGAEFPGIEPAIKTFPTLDRPEKSAQMK